MRQTSHYSVKLLSLPPASATAPAAAAAAAAATASAPAACSATWPATPAPSPAPTPAAAAAAASATLGWLHDAALLLAAGAALERREALTLAAAALCAGAPLPLAARLFSASVVVVAILQNARRSPQRKARYLPMSPIHTQSTYLIPL